MNAIEVKNLFKHFGTTLAVDGITFEVKEGEIMGFLGPNGAGKTTTIRCIMDFLRPDKGTIEVLGKDSHEASEKLKNEIGFLSGEVDLYNSWTGWDHINLIKNIRKVKTNEDELIQALSYDPSKKVKSLSTGNKQKLGIILALMHKPQLLILDEPTTGLDPFLQNAFYDFVRQASKEGRSILMSSHNLAEVERLCSRVAIIKSGKLVSVESMDELKRRKIYTISVYFTNPVKENELKCEGVESIKKIDGGFLIHIKEDIQPIMIKLGKYNIRDIEITHATLEDAFLSFYKQ